MSIVGDRIRELRKARKVTQTELGAALGVSKTYILELEKGYSENPTLRMLVNAARYFGVSVAYLAGEQDEGDEALPPQLAGLFHGAKDLTPEQLKVVNDMVTMLRGS